MFFIANLRHHRGKTENRFRLSAPSSNHASPLLVTFQIPVTFQKPDPHPHYVSVRLFKIRASTNQIASGTNWKVLRSETRIGEYRDRERTAIWYVRTGTKIVGTPAIFVTMVHTKPGRRCNCQYWRELYPLKLLFLTSLQIIMNKQKHHRRVNPRPDTIKTSKENTYKYHKPVNRQISGESSPTN